MTYITLVTFGRWVGTKCSVSQITVHQFNLEPTQGSNPMERTHHGFDFSQIRGKVFFFDIAVIFPIAPVARPSPPKEERRGYSLEGMISLCNSSIGSTETLVPAGG